VEARADLVHVAAQLLEPRELGQAAEPEDALEERRGPVADGAARSGLAAGLCQKAPLDQAGDGGVGGDSADTRDLGPRAWAEVRHDRQRLERGLRYASLRRLAEEARARVGRVTCGAEGVSAGDLLEDDPASSLPVALAEQRQRRFDALGLVLGRRNELVDR
jgi:hypothetical protein